MFCIEWIFSDLCMLQWHIAEVSPETCIKYSVSHEIIRS